MYVYLSSKNNNSTFHQTVLFKICKMYTFDQYIWLEITNSYTTKQLFNCFIN